MHLKKEMQQSADSNQGTILGLSYGRQRLEKVFFEILLSHFLRLDNKNICSEKFELDIGTLTSVRSDGT